LVISLRMYVLRVFSEHKRRGDLSVVPLHVGRWNQVHDYIGLQLAYRVAIIRLVVTREERNPLGPSLRYYRVLPRDLSVVLSQQIDGATLSEVGNTTRRVDRDRGFRIRYSPDQERLPHPVLEGRNIQGLLQQQEFLERISILQR